jgi:hypothetical protein
VENIVNSLFADYLPRKQQAPVGVADPRQQTMLTNQMLTPVMEKPVKPFQEVPVFPSVGGIGGGVVPTAKEEEETTEPVAYDPSNINLAAINNIDTGGFDITDLGLFQEGGIADDVFKGLDITQRDEVNPDAWVDIFNNYSNFLGGVQSGDTTKKVNRRDDIYNDWQKQNIKGKYSGDLSALRAAIGLSDAFSVYDTAGSTITNESLEGAYKTLTSGESFQKVLADYYGFDFQPATNEGANYTNAAKYGTNAQKMQEFQSLVEPILQKSIPYIQATQGLNYTDALEYAYTHDPMLNALYQSYGVDLYRQTKDGSTYIYDPIAGQEIRTLEVKDAKFKDFLPAIAIAVATIGVGSVISTALAKTSLGAALGSVGTKALGSAIAAGLKTAVTGGDVSDVLKDMATAGILNYGLNVLSSNLDVQDTLNKLGEELGFGTSVEAIQESGSFIPSALTEQGLTGGSFTGSLTQVGAQTGQGLGDVLGGIANAIANPSSWTPSSIEEANIIWNLAGEAVTTGGSLVGEGGLTVGTFYDLLKTAYGVYKDSNQPPPKLPNDFTITFDPNTNDPIIIDKDGNAVVGIPSAEDERKDKDDGGGGGGGGEAAKDAEAAKDSETAKDAESAKDAERSKDSENAKDAEAEKNKDAKKPEREDKESGGMSEAQKDQAAEKANKEMQAEEERENKEAEAARKEGADRNDRYTVIEILDDGTRIVRDNKTGRIFRANPTDERIDGVDYDFEDTEEDPFKDTTEDTTAEQLKKEGEERASKEAQAEQDTKETEERTTKEAETANKEQAEETANKEQAEAAKDTAERVAKETEATEKEAEKETKDAKAEQDQKDAEAEQVKKDKEKAAETTAKETAEGVEKEAEDDAKDAEEEKTNKDAESAKKETEATEEQAGKDREEKETKDAKAEQDQKETEAEVTSKETESSEKESEKNNKEETGTKEESVAKEESSTKEENSAKEESSTKEETQGKDQQGETELDFALNSKDGEEENPFVSNKDGEDANTAAGNKDGSGAGDGTGDGTGDGAGDGTGTGDGTGAGDGTGDGDGSGDGDNEGDGDGRGTGIGSGMLGGGSKPITPQSFMASISFAPELLTPYMPQNSRDYLGELLARLQQ